MPGAASMIPWRSSVSGAATAGQWIRRAAVREVSCRRPLVAANAGSRVWGARCRHASARASCAAAQRHTLLTMGVDRSRRMAPTSPRRTLRPSGRRPGSAPPAGRQVLRSRHATNRPRTRGGTPRLKGRQTDGSHQRWRCSSFRRGHCSSGIDGSSRGRGTNDGLERQRVLRRALAVLCGLVARRDHERRAVTGPFPAPGSLTDRSGR